MRPYHKGARAERELAKKLWSLGFAVVRSPASGGGRGGSRSAPDLVAAKKGKVLAIEVKAVEPGEPAKLTPKQVMKLLIWASRAWAETYVAVKVGNGGGWRFVGLGAVEKTGSSYVVKPEAYEKGLTLEELAKKVG